MNWFYSWLIFSYSCIYYWLIAYDFNIFLTIFHAVNIKLEALFLSIINILPDSDDFLNNTVKQAIRPQQSKGQLSHSIHKEFQSFQGCTSGCEWRGHNRKGDCLSSSPSCGLLHRADGPSALAQSRIDCILIESSSAAAYMYSSPASSCTMLITCCLATRRHSAQWNEGVRQRSSVSEAGMCWIDSTCLNFVEQSKMLFCDYVRKRTYIFQVK